MRNTILGILILISSSYRKDISEYPDHMTPFTGTHILAHKAGGGNANPYKENTLEAAIYGFSFLEGIETDIQMSRNGTLWLYHDEIIKDSDNKDKRIPGLTDTEINDLIKTSGFQMNTLQEVLQWKQDNNNEDYISLDIKSWLPTQYSNTQGYLIKVADEICKLSKRYNCGKVLLAECENANCLKRIKELDPATLCFLTTMGDYEKGAYRALKAKFDGLSYKYDGDNISEKQIRDLHAKGLQIQLWTINDNVEIKKAAGLFPDYIQTDNVQMK